MPFTYIRRAAVAFALLAAAGCTVKSTEPPPLTGPSGLALTLNVNAIPDAISQDGGSQSSVKVTAIGPDGKGLSGVPVRLDMMVGGVPQDYGTLSARSIVTSSDGVATAVYTAPPSPVNGVFGTCSGLPGNCVSIVATATSTNFTVANPEQVVIRLVPTGVILPPAGAPTAAFTYSPTVVSANLPIQFDASTSRAGSGATQITTYSWDFGDGSSGSGKNATHTFAAGNNFVVKLTVINDRGLSNSTTQSLGVGAGALPTSVFTFSPIAPGVNETVFFNAALSTAGQGHTISSYRWTFGDGGTATGVTASHAYATAGSYSAQLTVTDEAGQSTTSSATTILVGSPPAPNSNFTFSPTLPAVGQQVVFDASTSSTAQGQTIVDVAWNFGDGTPVVHCPGDSSCVNVGSTNRISAHTYQFAGIFAVNLVVTDSAGRTGSKALNITVSGNAPSAVLILSKTGGNGIQADGSGSTATGSSSITTYRFIWGDSTPDTVGSASSVSHTYAGAGTHTVTLVVTDNQSRTGSTSKDIVTP